MATTTTTSPIAVAALPEVFTIDDVCAVTSHTKTQDLTYRSVQVVVVPAAPDTDLYGDEAVKAWNIYTIEGEETRLGGQETRFIGRVTEVGVNLWLHQFVAEYVDHADEDLYIAEDRLPRKNSIRAAVRHYYSTLALRQRQAEHQMRREALASKPGVCQINGCCDTDANAHVILRERVYSACVGCREEYGLDVATAA